MKLAVTKAGSQSYMRHGGSKHVGNISISILDKHSARFAQNFDLGQLDRINNLTDK